MEIKITLVVKGSVKLTVTTDWQELIQVRSTSVALRRVFDLELRGIHLIEIILKVWVINEQYVIDVFICEVELRCCMNSDSYEYRNMSASTGTQFVPMGMLIICWKNFPAAHENVVN